MAYRFAPASNPILRCSIGAFNGYALRNGSGGGMSMAALFLRNGTGTWQNVLSIDDGTADYAFPFEFDPTNHYNGGTPNVSSWVSTVADTDATNFQIRGFTWDGTFVSGGWNWRYTSGAGHTWNTEAETAVSDPAASTTIGAGYRWMLANVTALGDDADYDLVCIGAIKGALSQATFQSLDFSGIASWDAVFTGANAWLIGCDAISSRTDRTGNGGNEVSRSAAGISLVSDPAGWSWGAAGPAIPELVMAPKLAR